MPANEISTQKKLIRIVAQATAATPIYETLSQNISKEYTSNTSDTIEVEMNSFPIFTKGATVDEDSAILIKSTPVTLGIVASTVSVSLLDMAVNIEDFDRKVSKPAGISFAASAESDLADHVIRNADNVTVSTGLS